MIEEIYSVKFVQDTNKMMETSHNKETKERHFPEFVTDYLASKYNKKPISDQHIINLAYSVEYHRRHSKNADMFYKFLNLDFENEDIMFYLFVRSCIEKELKILFLEKTKEDLNVHIEEEKDKESSSGNTGNNNLTTNPNITITTQNQPLTSVHARHKDIYHTQNKESEIMLTVKQCFNSKY